MAVDPSSALQALDGRRDLDVFGSARILLFALQLGLNIEDVETIADTALTDGSDDKKSDMV